MTSKFIGAKRHVRAVPRGLHTRGEVALHEAFGCVEVIDVSAHEPRRIPSKKWRELIKKVWEADPLRCPKCSREPNEVR